MHEAIRDPGALAHALAACAAPLRQLRQSLPGLLRGHGHHTTARAWTADCSTLASTLGWVCAFDQPIHITSFLGECIAGLLRGIDWGHGAQPLEAHNRCDAAPTGGSLAPVVTGPLQAPLPRAWAMVGGTDPSWWRKLWRQPKTHPPFCFAKTKPASWAYLGLVHPKPISSGTRGVRADLPRQENGGGANEC